MPKVSVIMGVYNLTNRDVLEKSIFSILNQTFTDFEFIICDDGSTDNTLEIVKDICKNDNRVIFLKNETNKGLAYVLNKCLENASGEYIARMDSDDESALNRFEKQVNFLDTHKEYGVVTSNADVFDGDVVWKEFVYSEEIAKEDFLFNNPIVHGAVMVRKSVYDKVNGYRDIPMTYRVEDYDLFMRIYSEGIKIKTLQEKLFRFREDKNALKRRKYRYRINEARVRFYGFKLLKLYPKGIIYVIKPLIVGLLPLGLKRKIILSTKK